MELKNAIGKTMEETKDWNWLDWWPVIDKTGRITGLVNGDDAVPSNYRMVNWDYKRNKYHLTDGVEGFDAFMPL